MKRFCLMGVALTLILCLLASTALAVDATILRVDKEEAEANGFYPRFRGVVALGDSVYVLASLTEDYYKTELLRWQPGMETAERYADGLLFSGNFDSVDQAKTIVEEHELDVDMEHGISRLFTDGERLLAVNHLNGKIFSVAAKDGKAVYEDVTAVKDASVFFHKEEDYAYFKMGYMMACMDGKLLWYYNDWDNQAGESSRNIMTIDLKDGSVTTAKVEGVENIAAYKDGKLLMLSRDSENAWDEKTDTLRPMDILSFDPQTGKSEKIGELDTTQWSLDFVAYSEALDALVYNQDTRIMGLFNNLKEKKQIGYIPMSYISYGSMLGENIVVASSDTGIIVRTLSKDFRTDEYVNVFNGYMDDAARAFAEEYPQIPVYSVTATSLDAVSIDLLMNAGADAPDIMQLGMGYGAYTRLAEKGYCEDLSSYPKLAAFVNDLYPPYKEAVTGPNGEIFSIPVYAGSYDGFSINKKVMNEMKLTPEELPTNLVELCEFITRWNNEFVDDYPNYTVLEYVSDYKASMFEMMYQRYIAYYNAIGEQLKFDTPIFREMMAALEAMECKELEAALKSGNPDPEVSDYKQGIIWRSDMLVGNWYDYSQEESGRIFIPMGLTKDAGFHTGVEMQVMFLNPKSQHKEAAVRLMEYMIEKAYVKTAYTLLSTKTEAVKNKYFEEWLEIQQKDLAILEKSLAEASEEEKAEWQAAVEEQKEYIQRRTPEMQYDISPYAIQNYRETIMPYVYVSTPTFLDSSDEKATSEFDSLKKQYVDGKIDIERFIREADGKLLMMQSE